CARRAPTLRSRTLFSFVRDLRPSLPRLAETDGHRLFAALHLPTCATLAGFQRAEFVFVHDLSDCAHVFGRRTRLRGGVSGGALFRFRHIVSSCPPVLQSQCSASSRFTSGRLRTYSFRADRSAMSFKRLLPVRFAARQSGVSQYAD